MSSMWSSSAPGSKVCKPDARSGVHWNFHTGVAEERQKNNGWRFNKRFCDLFLVSCLSLVNIHPASRGGPPTPQVFGVSPCKDIEHASKNCLQCFLIVFLQHPRNLDIFGQKVGPKHRFLQCCFQSFLQKQHNLRVLQYKVGPKHWFLQWVQYSNIPNPLNTSVFAVFFHCCPFFRCRKPPKSVFRLPEPPQNDPKFHLNTPFRSTAQKSSEKLRKHEQRKDFGAS